MCYLTFPIVTLIELCYPSIPSGQPVQPFCSALSFGDWKQREKNEDWVIGLTYSLLPNFNNKHNTLGIWVYIFLFLSSPKTIVITRPQSPSHITIILTSRHTNSLPILNNQKTVAMKRTHHTSTSKCLESHLHWNLLLEWRAGHHGNPCHMPPFVCDYAIPHTLHHLDTMIQNTIQWYQLIIYYAKYDTRLYRNHYLKYKTQHNNIPNNIHKIIIYIQNTKQRYGNICTMIQKYFYSDTEIFILFIFRMQTQ